MIINVKTHLLLPAILMFSFVTKALGMSSPPEDIMGATRSVDLSGNIFTFAMPENFSKDLPADPLLEKVDIDSGLTNTLLIQRWWDIKKPGFFGSNIGTVMMSINLLGVPENRIKKIHDKPHVLSDRLGLMLAINESLNTRYRDDGGGLNELYSIPSLVHLFGTDLETEYRDDVYNHQKWTSYSCSGPASQLIVNHVLPVSKLAFLEVSFVYSPNSGVLPRYFRGIAHEITSKVESTFHLSYSKGNSVKKLVEEEWMNSTVDEAVTDKRELLILKIFGPEHLSVEEKATALGSP